MTSYRYNEDFDNERVINKINELSEKIQEKIEEGENVDKEEVKRLMYAQLIQGLKLSVR